MIGIAPKQIVPGAHRPIAIPESCATRAAVDSTGTLITFLTDLACRQASSGVKISLIVQTIFCSKNVLDTSFQEE